MGAPVHANGMETVAAGYAAAVSVYSGANFLSPQIGS